MAALETFRRVVAHPLAEYRASLWPEMSWPSDGLPRFKLAETVGYSMGRHFSGRMAGNARIGFTLTILDRAYCHRAVWTIRSENRVPLAGAHRGGFATRAESNPLIRAKAAEQLAAFERDFG